MDLSKNKIMQVIWGLFKNIYKSVSKQLKILHINKQSDAVNDVFNSLIITCNQIQHLSCQT